MRPAPPDHAGDPVAEVSAWNLPNALTVLRLLLVHVIALRLLRLRFRRGAGDRWNADGLRLRVGIIGRMGGHQGLIGEQDRAGDADILCGWAGPAQRLLPGRARSASSGTCT